MSAGTPRVSIRIPPELWQAAQVAATAKGTTASAEVVRFLERYVRREQGPAGGRPRKAT